MNAVPLALPLSPADRLSMLPTHPVITRGFRLPTRALKTALEIMIHLIATGASGGSWVAMPRFGKSYGAEYCQQKLSEAFPQLPIFLCDMHHDQRPDQRSFYADLLQQSGFGVVPRADRFLEARRRLVRAWWSAACSKGSRTLLLIGDEMQCLDEQRFSWLIDVSNDLHKLDVRMVTIGFGQPELAHLRSAFKQTHRGDILGRYLARMYTFDGIRSALDLAEFMHGYDDAQISEYPPNSGISLAQFFLPEAFNAGWRLASHATQCWTEFCNIAADALSSKRHVEQLNVGMEWAASAIQYVLTHHIDFDSPRFRLKPSDWQEAIQSSHFATSLEMIYQPEGLQI